jgi:hypothetical protein
MSTKQFRTAPTFTEQIAAGITNSSTWYRYFQQNEVGTPPSPEMPLAVTASPFSYTAPLKGFVIVSGGTVSSIMFSRTAGTFYLTGQTTGVFPMAQNDVLKVTYSAKPTMTFIPT